MDISPLVIRIIALLIPGLISSSLYRKLRGKTGPRDADGLIEILLFAIADYALCLLVFFVANRLELHHWVFTAFDAFLDEKRELPRSEISWSSFLALPMAYAASLVSSARTINSLGRHFRVSSVINEEDVWTFFWQTFPKPAWVFVQDHKQKLIYYGHVDAYSDSGKDRELLLADVLVYDESGSTIINETPRLYVSRDRYELMMIVPPVPNAERGQHE